MTEDLRHFYNQEDIEKVIFRYVTRDIDAKGASKGYFSIFSKDLSALILKYLDEKGMKTNGTKVDKHRCEGSS